MDQTPSIAAAARDVGPGGRVDAGAWLAALAAALAFRHQPHLPAAEAALALAFCVRLLQQPRARTRIAGLPLALLPLCAWFALALAHGVNRDTGREVAQATLLMAIGVPVFACFWPHGRRVLLLGAGLGWGVCLAAGLAQTLAAFAGDGPLAMAGGTLGSRPLFSLALAALAPLVLDTAQRLERPVPGRLLAAGALLLAPAAFTFLPGLVLFCVGSAAWLLLCVDASRQRLLKTCLFAGLLAGLFLHHAELAASVALRDTGGHARRWVLESRAAIRASIDAPLLGHGPGRFQATVSSGRYRAFLERTLENRVEPGMQCGYLVLAVEYGPPAAALLLLALLLGARRAWRYGPREHAHALAVSLVTMAGAIVFTPPLVQGAGILLALLLGAAAAPEPSYTEEDGNIPPPAPWRRWSVQTAALALIAFVAFLAAPVGPCRELGSANVRKAGGGESFPTGAHVILVEAEDLSADGGLPPDLAVVNDEYASGGKVLAVKDSFDKRRAATVERGITVPARGNYHLWVRAWWEDGCGNSVCVRVGEGPQALVGNDGTYRVWHWVRGPNLALTAGRTTLALTARESGARVDQVLLEDAEHYRPRGLLGPRGAAATTGAGMPAMDRAAPWNSRGRPGRRPFRVGIGGMYQPGPESFLVQLGIPYDRLQDDELGEPGVIKRYDLVWVSGPQSRHDVIWRTLNAYIKAGGIAILEKMGERRIVSRFPYTAAEREVVPVGRIADTHCSRPRRQRRGRRFGPIMVRGQGSPFFAGLRAQEELYPDVWVSTIPDAPPGGEAHGELYSFAGERIGVVFTKRRLGRGLVYALALPLGNASMWRGTRFDRVGRKILLDAVAGRYDPIYGAFAWKPVYGGRVFFTDDFMRVAGEGDAWRVQSGAFHLTGAPPPAPPHYSRRRRAPGPPHPFALCGTAPGLARAGDPAWRDYRLAVSVFADGGRGGLWLTTSRGRRLSLEYEAATGRLSLSELGGGKGKTAPAARGRELARAVIPGPRQGWRRLALMHAGGEWRAWIDGRVALRLAAAAETAQGGFGIIHSRGEAYYDDVSARDVTALVPGTDRCPGEEGSCRSDMPVRRGLEPRTIYACQWYLRPDPRGRHAFVPALPLYGPSLLRMDGRILGRVAPAPEGGLVYLPAGKRPRHDIELITAGWRDYNFFEQCIDWYATGGEWKRISRWSCDQKWEWLGVKQESGRAALWYRHPLSPPYCISVLCCPTMGARRGFHEKDRDLNLVLAGNGRDLTSGLLLRTGPARGAGSRLLLGDKQLAANPLRGLPAGGGLTLHHRWLWLKAVVERRRVRCFYEGKLAIDVRLRQPVGRGFVGFWTENNSVQVARVTLSFRVRGEKHADQE